jgi:hypothetical protein
MSFIYCHLNFHANVLRPWRFPLNVTEASRCTILNISEFLSLWIITIYRVETCKLLLTKHILVYLSDYTLNNCILAQALVARNYLPPFLTFCLHIYFFNRISLFLIISSRNG